MDIRGTDEVSGSLFSYVDLEARIPARHPLRKIRQVRMTSSDDRFRRITLSYGYAEEPDVPQALMLLRRKGLKFDIMSTSFILSRRSLRLSVRSELPYWQARLFIYLARNATAASDYFRIPAGRVVELGVQISI
nr:hypothetical protein [Sinirhodobacter populi]